MCPVLGTVVSAFGSIASGMAQASVANYNAKVAKMNAEAAVREGFYNAGTARDQYQEVAGAQRAALGKAGVNIDSGTADLLQIENQKREEVAAGLDIWRGRTQQTAYKNQASQFKAEGAAAMTGGIIGGLTSLVGGLSKAGTLPFGGAGGLGTASPAVTGLNPIVVNRNPYGLLSSGV